MVFIERDDFLLLFFCSIKFCQIDHNELTGFEPVRSWIQMLESFFVESSCFILLIQLICETGPIKKTIGVLKVLRIILLPTAVDDLSPFGFFSLMCCIDP